MGTPRYPRTLIDDVRDLKAARPDVQTSGQSRVPFLRTSQGFILENLPGDPAAPASGVILYAKSGHLYCREADGSVHQLTS